jgi:opacity protein-like surface antigen
MPARTLMAGATVALATIVATPATASADWTFTPFIGSTFDGRLNDVDLDLSTGNRLSWGGTLTWMGEGIAGFELDLGFTPEFFFNERDEVIDFIGDGNVFSLMGNVVFGIPIGGDRGAGFRPYATAGAGLMRQKVDDIDDAFDTDDNSWGFNVGGGVMCMFSDAVGIRGDLRYFRSFKTDIRQDLGDLEFDLSGLEFWRGTVGVTFRFGS